MKYIEKLLLIISIAGCFFSCTKFTDVTPKGYVIPGSYDDFDKVLNYRYLAYLGNSYVHDLTDDEDLPFINSSSNNYQTKVYLWSSQFENDLTSAPIFWTNCFQNIMYYNVVLNGIPGTVTDSVGLKLRGDALLGQAFEYLYLVNLYAKTYDPENSKADPGIPLVTSVDATTPIPARATVQEVYDYIISSIHQALPALPNFSNAYKFRGSKHAAYSVLARTFLNMSQYDSASYYAQKAADGMNVLDYRTFIDPNGFAGLSNDVFNYNATSNLLPNSIYPRDDAQDDFGTFSLGLLHLYNPHDIRLQLQSFPYSPDDSTFLKRGKVPYFPVLAQNNGTSVEEMILIMAEDEARKGNTQTCLDLINQVHINRFLPEDYQPVTALNSSAALDSVFAERRREFAFTGLRWFDMRRLIKENKMNDVVRLDGNGNEIATLKPNDPRYVLQIPQRVIKNNPGMKQN